MSVKDTQLASVMHLIECLIHTKRDSDEASRVCRTHDYRVESGLGMGESAKFKVQRAKSKDLGES